jgi:uroporphyrinogen-III synthase
MRLLLTRPREDAERSAAALRALGHEVMIVPVLKVEPVAAEFGSGPWAAAILTSANAARALAGHPRHAEIAALPVFAVGPRTAAAALAAGCTDVRAADGDGGDLAALIAAQLPDRTGRLIYLAGADRASGLEAALAEAGFAVDTCIVYRAAVDPSFARNLAAIVLDRSIDGVLHYSRRSAVAFRTAVTDPGSGINSLNCHHYCLSGQVAEPLRDGALGAVEVATRPDEAALLALLT